MRLKTQLILEQARITGTVNTPTKEEPIVTLNVRAALTRAVAESFGCSELIYAGNVPRSGVDQFTLEGEEIDCAVHFKHDNIAFDVVSNSVGKYVAKMEGTGPVLQFRIKLSGYATTVAELVEAIHVDPLEITLKPAQMDLGLVENVAATEEEPAGEPEPEQSDFMADVGVIQ